jgi:hypothetical protein
VRIAAMLDRPVLRVEVTPEWRRENDLKQLRYEARRAAWLKKVGTAEVGGSPE